MELVKASIFTVFPSEVVAFSQQRPILGLMRTPGTAYNYDLKRPGFRATVTE
jgi:hypothetical protein